MKKNFLTFIFLLFIFSLVNFNSALAQDPGVPDTAIVERLVKVVPNTQVILNVYIINDSAIGGYTIPLAFPNPATDLDVICDSVSFVGTRSASATYRTDTPPPSIDNDSNQVNVFAIWFVGDLPPGNISDGPVAKIYFSTGPDWDSTLSVQVDTMLWPPASKLEFSTTYGRGYVPIFYRGALEVREVSSSTKPTVFSLSQNYPNPFNPKTIIRFALPRDSWVKLEVYNVLGQRVKTLVDEKLSPGLKEVEWDGKDDKGFEVSSGIYFYKIEADVFSDIKKMVMLK